MLDDLIELARTRSGAVRRRVVLPEGTAASIIRAAARARDLAVARPVLLGPADGVRQTADRLGVGLSGIDVVDPVTDQRVEQYATEYCADHVGFPPGAARRMFTDTLYFAAMLTGTGDADAMVAGLEHSTAEVLLASQSVLGMEEGVDTPSSMFVMDVPGYPGGEKGMLAFADCAVVPAPTAEQLATIARSTAGTVSRLLGWEPRVALLSFSTKGSGQGESVDRVTAALDILRRSEPCLAVDGELQLDAALVAHVAATKLQEAGPVAGRANVLIFPDLDAGNIGYKLVQRLAGAGAYGPLLQGFNGTVSDLSRGATDDDILAAIALTSMGAPVRVP